MKEILLYIVPSTNYFQNVCNIIKEHICPGKFLIYVTTNKSTNHLKGIFEGMKINAQEIFFIDCISKSIGDLNKEDKNCICLEGPQEITGLSIAINKAVQAIPGEKVLFIDSLSALLIYNDDCTIAKFSNFIINKMRINNVKTIIIALDSDADTKTIKIVSSFADEVKKDAY